MSSGDPNPVVESAPGSSSSRRSWFRAVSFLVVVGIGFALGRYLYASPAAWISDQVHDFGRVTSSGKLRHTFTFRNWSLSPLQIGRVRTTCGCTVAKYTEKAIAPLGTGQVDTELNLEGKNDRVETEVHLEFGNRGRTTFTLRATVVPLSPSLVDMGRILRGVATSRSFALMSANGTDPLQVKGHHFSRPGLRAEFSTSEGTPERVEVKVSATEDIAPGPLQSVLTVDTSDGRMPAKEVRFIGFVVPPVEAVPSQVSLGYFGVGKRASAELTLRSAYGESLELTGVELPDTWLELRQRPSSTPDKLNFVLSTHDTSLEPGLHSADALFHVVAAGKALDIKVRVFGYVFANSNPFGAAPSQGTAAP